MSKRAEALPNLHVNMFEIDLAGRRLTGVSRGYKFRMDLQKLGQEDLFLDYGGTKYCVCGLEQLKRWLGCLLIESQATRALGNTV